MAWGTALGVDIKGVSINMIQYIETCDWQQNGAYSNAKIVNMILVTAFWFVVSIIIYQYSFHELTPFFVVFFGSLAVILLSLAIMVLFLIPARVSISENALTFDYIIYTKIFPWKDISTITCVDQAPIGKVTVIVIKTIDFRLSKVRIDKDAWEEVKKIGKSLYKA